MGATTLSNEFKEHFNISDVCDSFPGGQKLVYIVIIENQKYALKIFKGFGKREERELEFYDKYKHIEYIPKLLKKELWRENYVIIEEYIDGNALSKIKSKYKSDTAKIYQLLSDIINTMTILWENKIIHRDLKPDNIIIDKNCKPHIIDFGIAKDLDHSAYTNSGFQPHSWRYGAPEQLEGIKDRISYRTDFFSLGVIAYELYYQKLPFGDDRNEIEKMIRNKKIVFESDSNCMLNSFFDNTLKYHVSERAGKIGQLLGGLNI